MQRRIWDFSEIDSTAYMNDVILALVRKQSAGLRAGGVLKPGRITGFRGVANSTPDNSIDLERDGYSIQMAVTNDGVIVIEDADLDDPVTFGNVNSANPRIDLLVLKHAYSASLPNTQARYVVITGTAATKPVPPYASVAADETPLVEVYIDPTPGIGNPPDISDADIKTVPTAVDALISDAEHTWGRTNNEFGDAGIWMRGGRNDDHFYIMRDPTDSDRVLFMINAYWEFGATERCSGVDGATISGTNDQFSSAAIDFDDAGVKPGDQLVITVSGNGNTGTYTVTEVDLTGDPTGHTITIDGNFPGTVPSTSEQFYVTSVAERWYQEDPARRSFLATLSEKDGSSNEIFGIYKCDKGTEADTFANFWTNLMSSTEDGDLTWPLLFAGQNLVYGCQISWEGVDELEVQVGKLYNNGTFRSNSSPEVVDINDTYNAGTLTWGCRSGESKTSGWWFVYATTDITGSGFGVGLSQTAPSAFTLQHPSDADWRWIGSAYYVGTYWRRFIKVPGGFTSWSAPGVASLIPYSGSLQTVSDATGVPPTSNQVSLKLYWFPADGGSINIYLADTRHSVETLVLSTATHSDHDTAYSALTIPWVVNSSGQFKTRRYPTAAGYWTILGYWEDINSPLSDF